MGEHITLSEKLEDLKNAADWGKEQKEKQRKNDEIGEKLWKKIFPVLTGGAVKTVR